MLREPQPVEHFHVPPDFLCPCVDAPFVTLPLGVQVNRLTLRRFVRAMAAEGLALQSARLGYDSCYAYDAFARAHASDYGALREMALELFAAFERRAA